MTLLGKATYFKIQTKLSQYDLFIFSNHFSTLLFKNQRKDDAEFSM